MHYWIDGYNLLFSLIPYSEDLQSRREAIIHDLNQKITLLNLDVSIVFDGAFQMGGSTRGHYDKIEILFTGHGETADEYLLEEVKNCPHPQKETIVTSDKKLAWLVRNRLAHTESVEDFIFRINRTYKKKLRQQKQEKPSIASSSPLLQPQPQSGLFVPEKQTPLEACSDYYLQAFEAGFKEIKEEEKQKEIIAASLEKKSKPLRKPKKRADPFEEPQTIEEKTSTEMDRWLKLFEKR